MRLHKKLFPIVIIVAVITAGRFSKNSPLPIIYRVQNTSNSKEFIYINDSLCYLRSYNAESFCNYSLWKGYLLKSKNCDTLFEFHYQPLVEFYVCKRGHYRQDSVYFNIKSKDTFILPFITNISIYNNSDQQIKITDSAKLHFLKGAGTNNFIIDTKFIDPISNKKVIVSIHPTSSPDFRYYGSTTPYKVLSISIFNNHLIEYAENKPLKERNIFIKAN